MEISTFGNISFSLSINPTPEELAELALQLGCSVPLLEFGAKADFIKSPSPMTLTWINSASCMIKAQFALWHELPVLTMVKQGQAKIAFVVYFQKCKNVRPTDRTENVLPLQIRTPLHI